MASFRRFQPVITVLCVALAGPYLADLAGRNPALAYAAVELSQPSAESGNAFQADLSGQRESLAASSPVLYERGPAKGGPIASAEPILGGTRVHYVLANLIDARFPSQSTSVWRRLGPEAPSEADVESAGEGRYAVAEDRIVFSASDNSSPLTNGRTYQLRVPYALPFNVPFPVRLLGLVAALFLVLRALPKLPRVWTILCARSRLFRNLAPGVVVSAIGGVILFGAAEVYLRATIPFTEGNNVFVIDPKIGASFRPGAEVRFTNHLDFWTVSTVNSLGFVDREPTLPKDDDTFRVVVVGDSYVAALQVELGDKFPALLETRLRQRFPDRSIDVVAMGVDGTGQANQLAFLETYGPSLAPDLVVMLFVRNDFADNSPLLQMIEKGMNPDHAPSLFFMPSADGYERTPIDQDSWANRLHLTWGETIEQRFAYAESQEGYAESL